jgi:DNA-binding NarL/FixJ family response regulator
LTGEPPERLRVLIVEDHVALGDALRLAVDLAMECVGVAGTVAEALERAAATRPDAVLMDVRLPDGDGIEAAARLKDLRPQACVIILTAGADPGALLRAAEAGASGFLPKETRMAAILEGVRRTVAGEPVVSPSALQSLLAAARHRAPSETGPPALSPADRELLALLAEGQGLAAVASRLGITPEECRARTGMVAAALGARSPLQALAIAAREGLLSG